MPAWIMTQSAIRVVCVGVPFITHPVDTTGTLTGRLQYIFVMYDTEENTYFFQHSENISK